MTLSKRFDEITKIFLEIMPNPKPELDYKNPYELLVAVMLSAQCTDKRVNLVTPKLFESYPDFFSLSKANFSDVLFLIKSISYPNSKAKHLIECAQKVVNDFDGILPKTIKELTSLSGVGNKTASVVGSVLFNLPVIPVDTHVFRVANRLGLSPDAKNPNQTQKILENGFRKDYHFLAHHWLLLFGRYTCTALKPKCLNCKLTKFCQYNKK